MTGRVEHVIVDGANFVGARPDGWWRDRAGAARRLVVRIVAALAEGPQQLAQRLGRPLDDDGQLHVHLVLEGVAAGAVDLPAHSQLTVVRVDADGDTAIADLADALVDDPILAAPVLVVTADRALRRRVGPPPVRTLCSRPCRRPEPTPP